MSRLSKVLHSGEDGAIIFWCPACETYHVIKVGIGAGPRWSWDGDVDHPTFAPSVKVTGVTITPKGWQQYEERLEAGSLPSSEPLDNVPLVCHFFVRKGLIEYLNDCTHSMAGKTVVMAELPQDG